MKTDIAQFRKTFIENRDVIKLAFPFESAYLHPVCAVVIANSGKTVDVQRLKDCRALLKSSVSAFSNFRGISSAVLISMLAADDAPQKRLEIALKAYTSLKKHFFSGNYLPLAAMIISKDRAESEFDSLAERTREIYDLMMKEHPFLTSGEDSVFAALIALSGGRPSDMITETERCYRILKERFFSANAVQSLSHVLALCEGRAEGKCQRAIELFDALKARGMRYGADYELAPLGVLAMLPEDSEYIISEMEETDRFLATQKGYGFWGLGKRQRLMHAAMIVTSAPLASSTLGETAMAVSAQQTAIVAAQQAAICAAIAAQAASNAAN